MKSIAKFLGGCSLLVDHTGNSYALLNLLPEPGSIGLVALGIAGVVYFSRRK